ncbi:radical SAM/SPASM domain-containing protein [Lachnospiraceae bacterium KK002]|uniref:radical SAM/SPASM domain-containing protein n=1 Tax=Eubacterium sp. 14-2 TaxID=1235790 RepID=UPI0003391180|nr:radical SAM/SPASM domain-containing protein [Eubacterium sp. 14-2]EOT23616.1 hypothetical protein C805_03281 [Eubacterium sp. 14-2]
MPAIRQGKIYARERINLGSAVPLEVPFSVQIDVCSACNMKCKFCYHSDSEAIKREGVKFGMMSYGLFCKIIDDMKTEWRSQGRKIKKLRLFKAGESLLHPEICAMVQYAKESDVAECIELTTNGTLLSESMSESLIKAGLDILNISVNGISREQYRDVCQYDLDFEEFRKKIKFFYDRKQQCKLFLKYSDIGYTQEERDSFYDMFENCCDEIFVETISSTLWPDTNVEEKIANAEKGTYGQELKEKKVCPFLFTTMVINDAGIAHLCCVDWKLHYILGDLKKEKISAVWAGERLRTYQCKHLKGEKNSIKICEKCESLSANTIDDIDDYAEAILKRFGEGKI